MLGVLRNRFAPHIDFTFLKGAIRLNPKVLPSNIDMVYEHKGKFLFGEWKKEGENISLGQEILLKNLAKNSMVLLITGDTNPKVNISKIHQITEHGMRECGRTEDDLKNIINQWYEEASYVRPCRDDY
jgi:hypothetical protein